MSLTSVYPNVPVATLIWLRAYLQTQKFFNNAVPLRLLPMPTRSGTMRAWHRMPPQDRSRNKHGRLRSRVLARYLMSTILYLPTPAKGRSQAPIQESAAQETVSYCCQTERIAHDLKNCMSVILLAMNSIKDNQPLMLESRKRVLEHVVEEMNRLVDEMVTLAGRHVNK